MPAEPTLLYTNAAGQLFADPNGFLRTYWAAAPRTLADTQALFTNIAQALQARGWGRVLVNQIGMRPFLPAEQQWVAQEWLPLAVRAGYRHGAIVVSPNVMVRLATAYVTTQVQGLPLLYRSFETETEAAQWLLRQPVSP